MKNKKIYIVSHKKYQPYIDEIREIIKVGNSNLFHEKIEDSKGDNIAYKNSSYCELTALYWIWKNDKSSDVVGIEHYRRQFLSPETKIFKIKYINSSEIDRLLNEYDVIVARKWHTKKKNLDESIKFSSNHVYEDFEILENIINKDFNEYYDSYKKIMYDSNGFNPFNMIICNKELFDTYCKWIFEILEKIEQKINISNRRGNIKRVFGYMSEILLTVWLNKNNINYYENKVFFNHENKFKNFLERLKLL